MNITNAQFTATGSITALVDGVQMSIPADAGNRHYAAMIEQGITPAEYPTATEAEQLDAERAGMTCSPLQGILALGEQQWNRVLAYRDTASWQEKVIIDSAQDWKRLSENIAFFQYLLDLTDEQTDDLFIAAAEISA